MATKAGFEKSEKEIAASSSADSSSRGSVDEKLTKQETNRVKSQILADYKPTKSEPTPALNSLWKRSAKHDPNEIATKPSVYDDPEQAKYFQPHEKYENLHRFDPSFKWTWGEEKKLVRRIDWKVTVWAICGLFALNLDRSNISQANTDNFLKDMKLTTNDYNLGTTVFRVSFLLAELPSQLISKKLGPDRWVPTQMIMWSIVATCQFWLSNRSSFLATRALLGMIQGGFIPDVILYMSYFYTGTELPFRLALFYLANKATEVVSPIMAFGILRLRGVHGYAGWRWLFLIEGILTLGLGIWSVFMMAPSPTQTKAWWRKNGWFTEHEEKILVNRILRDDPSKGDMHNRQAITPMMLLKSLSDWHLWPIYIIGMTWSIPTGPPQQYLTLTLRGLGFDTFESNLLSIPAAVGQALNMLLMTWISERIDQRALMGMGAQLWLLPCLLGLVLNPAKASKWGTYAMITTLLVYPYPHAMQVAWNSRNSNTVRTRTVSAAVYNMTAQMASIISANIYRQDDAPLYRRGNKVLVGICCWNIIAYPLIKLYYTRVNASREKIWSAMSVQEQIEYRNTTKDQGSNRLDFRFAS